jgi:transcriptional regulator with XRE-family HTH domain
MPTVKPPRIPLAERLGMAVRFSGLSLSELSRRSRVAKSQLSQFLNGGDMRLKTADKLCAVLGLELVQSRPPATTEAGGKRSF